jgi:hypothetical protein
MWLITELLELLDRLCVHAFLDKDDAKGKVGSRRVGALAHALAGFALRLTRSCRKENKVCDVFKGGYASRRLHAPSIHTLRIADLQALDKRLIACPQTGETAFECGERNDTDPSLNSHVSLCLND